MNLYSNIHFSYAKFLVFFVPLFFSCKTINAPLPEIENEKLTIEKQKISVINLPISIRLKPFYKEINSAAPKKFNGAKNTCEGVSYSYVFKRSPLTFYGLGNQLISTINGKYSLKLNYCPKCTSLFNKTGNCVIPRIYASCGVDEPMKKIKVQFGSYLKLNKDYSIHSSTKLLKLNLLDPCKITVFKYDATNEIQKEFEASLKVLAKDIDSQIEETNFKKDAQILWDKISEPIPLSSFGYLYINPKKISLSDINYKNDIAYLNFNLYANPIFNSSIDSSFKLSKVPDLSTYKKENGFSIEFDIKESFDSLSMLINNKLKDSSIIINKHKFIFKKCSIFNASNTKIGVKISFSGKNKGTLFLIGTPNYNTEEEILSFPDLDFDIKSKNILLKSAKWLLNKKVKEKMVAAAVFNLDEEIRRVKKKINTALNKEYMSKISLSGTVDKINIKQISLEEKALFIRAVATGSLNVSL